MTGRDKRRVRLFWNPVDDGQPRVDRRAMPGIDAAVDARGEHEGSAVGKIGIKRLNVGVCWIMRRGGEHHKASALW